jgi:hypothetical protein
MQVFKLHITFEHNFLPWYVNVFFICKIWPFLLGTVVATLLRLPKIIYVLFPKWLFCVYTVIFIMMYYVLYPMTQRHMYSINSLAASLSQLASIGFLLAVIVRQEWVLQLGLTSGVPFVSVVTELGNFCGPQRRRSSKEVTATFYTPSWNLTACSPHQGSSC